MPTKNVTGQWIGKTEDGREQYLQDNRVYLLADDGTLYYCHSCTLKYLESKLPQAVYAQKLDWDFGGKKSVEEAVAVAIAKNAKVPAPPKPVKTAPPKPAVSKYSAPLHYHKCGACGYVFGHTDASYGNRAEHMCPKCGYGPNYHVIGR